MFSIHSIRGMAMNGSLARLESLMGQRQKEGTEGRSEIDRRIWDLFGETWAVMYTDLSGFSRKVADFGIIHFLQVIYESQRILTPCIDLRDGILLKVEADSMMVIFRNPASALHCAVDMQRETQRYNAGRPATDQVLLCIGLGYGRMLRIGDDDVFGEEVNAASKLGEDTAKPGEILATAAVRDACGGVDGAVFDSALHTLPGTAGVFSVRYEPAGGATRSP
jgi:class 3 adenylate cyclase